MRDPINPYTEVKIGRCVFSKSDIAYMYIDQGLSIRELAERLEISIWKAYRILDKFNIPTSWKQELTPRRFRVLRYIARYQRRYGKSPNLSEIAKALEIPVSGVHFHIRNLERLGFLEWNSRRREIRLKGRCRECLRI